MAPVTFIPAASPNRAGPPGVTFRAAPTWGASVSSSPPWGVTAPRSPRHPPPEDSRHQPLEVLKSSAGAKTALAALASGATPHLSRAAPRPSPRAPRAAACPPRPPGRRVATSSVTPGRAVLRRACPPLPSALSVHSSDTDVRVVSAARLRGRGAQSLKQSVDGGLPGLGEGAHGSRDRDEPVAALGPRGPAPCS